MILTAVQFAWCLAFNGTPCEGSLYMHVYDFAGGRALNQVPDLVQFCGSKRAQLHVFALLFSKMFRDVAGKLLNIQYYSLVWY